MQIGQKFTCAKCGIEVAVTKACSEETCDMVCCGEQMSTGEKQAEPAAEPAPAEPAAEPAPAESPPAEPAKEPATSEPAPAEPAPAQ